MSEDKIIFAACHNFACDHDNKLIRVSKGETTLVSYEYDALGRRVKSTGLPSQGLVRYYLSSGQNEVAEYDGAGQRLRYYVHGPTYIDERVVMHNDPVAGGAATTGSDYIYLLKDLYTVAGMADERGWPVERYDYDAYGKVYMERVRVLPWAADFDGDGDVDADDLAVLHAAYKGSGQEPNGVRGWRADLDGDGDVDGSDYALFADAYRGSGVAPGGGLSLRSASMVVSRIGNPYFFTGRRLDVIDIQNAGTPHHFTDDCAGLQVYDYRRRTYDPDLGRFGQRDRMGYLDGMSPYSYVGSCPVGYLDPSGLVKQNACCSYRIGAPPQIGQIGGSPTFFADITYDESKSGCAEACDCWAKSMFRGWASDVRAENNSCNCGVHAWRASTKWGTGWWRWWLSPRGSLAQGGDIGHTWITVGPLGSPGYGWGDGDIHKTGWIRRPDMEASVTRSGTGHLGFGSRKSCTSATCQDISACMEAAAADFDSRNKWQEPVACAPLSADPEFGGTTCTTFARSVLSSCCLTMGGWK